MDLTNNNNQQAQPSAVYTEFVFDATGCGQINELSSNMTATQLIQTMTETNCQGSQNPMSTASVQSMALFDQTSPATNSENLTQLKLTSDQQTQPFSQHLWKTQTNQTLLDLKSLLSSWGMVELYEWFLGICAISLLITL